MGSNPKPCLYQDLKAQNRMGYRDTQVAYLQHVTTDFELQLFFLADDLQLTLKLSCNQSRYVFDAASAYYRIPRT